MEDHELRKRIQAIDPISEGVEVRSVDDLSSQQMLEGIMNMPDESTRSRPAVYLLGAAAVTAVVLGAVAFFGPQASGPDVVASPPLELSLGESDAMASCIVPSAEILADIQVAFAGTVTSVDGETVTLEVDEWFVGGDAATVELFAPGDLVALIGGIDFIAGENYLISAYDGTVNYCGMSGPATPELQALYDAAFAG